MDAARIQARAVVKVAAISLAVIAVALLLAIVVLQVRTEIRWVFAALFLALAMNPAVDRVESLRVKGHEVLPRWLAILVVQVSILEHLLAAITILALAFFLLLDVAIVAILVGGELAGILDALVAIPTAVTIGVLIDEWLLYRRDVGGGANPGEAPVAQPEPAAD